MQPNEVSEANPLPTTCLRVFDRVTRGMSRYVPARLQLIARFGLVGILATAFYFLLVNVLVLGFHIEASASSVYSYAVSVIFSYALQSRVTFGVMNDSRRQIGRFLLTSLAGLAISYWVMVFFTETLSAPYVIGGVMICILIPLINFAMLKYWVFTEHNDRILPTIQRRRDE